MLTIKILNKINKNIKVILIFRQGIDSLTDSGVLIADSYFTNRTKFFLPTCNTLSYKSSGVEKLKSASAILSLFILTPPS
jgi:hypothetical protein